MPGSPIGVSFLPSAENQELGVQRGRTEGDLGEALKILALQLPRVQGARAIAPRRLLTGEGAQGFSGGFPTSRGGEAGGFNPDAAFFEAMIRALLGGEASSMGGSRSAVPDIDFYAPPNRPGPLVDESAPVAVGGQTTRNWGNYNPGQQGPFSNRGPYRGTPQEY